MIGNDNFDRFLITETRLRVWQSGCEGGLPCRENFSSVDVQFFLLVLVVAGFSTCNPQVMLLVFEPSLLECCWCYLGLDEWLV
jgi:hypothetical protein